MTSSKIITVCLVADFTVWLQPTDKGLSNTGALATLTAGDLPGKSPIIAMRLKPNYSEPQFPLVKTKRKSASSFEPIDWHLPNLQVKFLI